MTTSTGAVTPEIIPEQLTVSEALAQSYEYYIYSNGDRWQSLGQISDTASIDFKKLPLIIEKEGQAVWVPSSKDLGELIADHMQGNWDDETGDDSNDVYDSVKELDFSEMRTKIEEAVKDKHYYRATKIKLVP